MGTALQHLADSLFVHLANLILLRRDSYLEFVKPGVKPDMWNLLRKAPMFGYGLFPDSVLNTAEQDINKHESAGVAPGPGPGASQHSNWRGNFRYRPYDKRDTHRRTEPSEQEQQPWRQFSRNRGRGRTRGRASSRFPRNSPVVKEVKLMAQARGIRIHQYLNDWLLRAPCQATCLLHTQTLLALCQELGWVVNMKKSELIPQQVFNFVGYQFDLVTGRVLPTQDRWSALKQKLKFIRDRNSCTVRQFMSLIGLLTATEKQVWSGRLHMRPIQWYLKRHWHVPEVLEKVIPLPQSLHPHLDWWLDESNVLRSQALHPLQLSLQVFTDASNEGWGAHLGDSTARGVWSEPESRLHINFLELKAVFLALKSFEDLCWDQVVLIATDNTTVVSYINKEGGMRSGSLCALLWRLLSWCHPRGIVLRARHILGRLNVVADKLSRHNQVIQTEWSLSQQVFNLLCLSWGHPQLDLFATLFNHKLPRFVSPVPDQKASMGESGSLRVSPSISSQPSDL